MLEGQFTAKLLKKLRSHSALRGAAVVKLSDKFTKGLPDVLVCVNERTTYFEVKTDPEVPEKIQRYWLERLRPSYVVIASRDGALSWFEEGGPVYDIEGMANEIARRALLR